MEVTLLNYKNDKIQTEGFPDLDSFDVVRVDIAIVYGDEIIAVHLPDEDYVFEYASDVAAWPGGFDGSYVIYERRGLESKPDINLLDDPRWQARKDSYEFLWAD